MNKVQKIVWTAYLFLFVILFLRSVGGMTDDENALVAYIVFGWVPFLIAHFIWRDKKKVAS